MKYKHKSHTSHIVKRLKQVSVIIAHIFKRFFLKFLCDIKYYLNIP